MNKIFNMIVCLVLISIFFSKAAVAEDINSGMLLVPDFVDAQIVSDNMNMNGMELGIVQFKTNRPYSDIYKFYKSEIGNIKESKFESWKIISWIDDKKLIAVQVTVDKLSKTTHGYVSVSDLPAILKKDIKLGKGFPALGKSTIINDITATDLNKKSRTIWLTNHSSVQNNINYYIKHYESNGWTIEQRSIDESGRKSGLMMRKDGNKLNLTANKDPLLNDTNVIAVIVEI